MGSGAPARQDQTRGSGEEGELKAMCFKNLPIEFDEQGKAYLKPGVRDPFEYQRTEISRDQIKELMARNGFVRSFDLDPVTRVAGALAFHTTVDLQARKVLEAASMATLFRGYEVILKGRDPRDAIFIISKRNGSVKRTPAPILSFSNDLSKKRPPYFAY